MIFLEEDLDPFSTRKRRQFRRRAAVGAIAAILLFITMQGFAQRASGAYPAQVDGAALAEVFSPGILAALGLLLFLSAFLSGSESAFFSINRLRLRSLAEEGTLTGTRVARIMEHPEQLLTTILVGNTIVNVLIGVVLGGRAEFFFRQTLGPGPGSYLATVALTTTILVFFGEIFPKVLAVSTSERYARATVLPLILLSRLLAPPRNLLLWFTNQLFHVTRFHDLRAAPFITDEEFKLALSEGEVQVVLEEDERDMIRGILEFRDARVREFLVPRPDVVAVPAEASVGDALETLREHEYSRMPVYQDDMDTVLGILVAKDLLPSFTAGELDKPVRKLLRPVLFVPETMTAQQFVEEARRHRAHMAVVVDEYGGTEGIVTLEDAIEQVVGDILDEGEQEHPPYEKVGEGVYRVEGGLSIDRLSELLGTEIEDEEHETVAGFLMDRAEKVPEPGDEIVHAGMRFTVEAVEGKRALSVLVKLMPGSRPLEENGEDDT
jgi:putative hemolysin